MPGRGRVCRQQRRLSTCEYFVVVAVDVIVVVAVVVANAVFQIYLYQAQTMMNNLQEKIQDPF